MKRSDRVTDGDDPNLDDGRCARAVEVHADYRRHADHTEEKADGAGAAQVLALTGAGCDHDRDERHRGDEETGQRAREMLLGGPEQDPGNRDLDHREHEQRPPVAEQRPEFVAPCRER